MEDAKMTKPMYLEDLVGSNPMTNPFHDPLTIGDLKIGAGVMLGNIGEMTTKDLEELRAKRESDYDFRGPEGPQGVEDPIHPDHYHHGGIDVFDYGEANFSKEAVAGFYRMNILKYVTRYDRKNGIEDLEKAKVYLIRLLTLERGSDDE
jgi:hypothetical protein